MESWSELVKSIAAFPAEADAAIILAWTGNDVGAGIGGYDIYVSTNGGPWTLWLENTPLQSATFLGQFPNSYGFYSIARDGTGLREAPPSVPDAQTKVTHGNSSPIIPTMVNATLREGELFSLQVVATDPNLPADTLTFELLSAPSGMTINFASGLIS